MSRLRPMICSCCFGALAIAGTAPIGAASAASCSPTKSDYLGPFYVSGMPVLKNLNRFGEPGEKLLVTGTIRSASDRSPIANARIEVWQTDGKGRYHPQGQGKRSKYKDRDLDLRGTVISDEDGRFEFETVVPGTYRPRPRHFHYRITAPGHRTLVTQHYVREGKRMPGGKCRSAHVTRTGGQAKYAAPDIFLRRR